MQGQGGVVRLHHGVRHLGGGEDGERGHDLVRIFLSRVVHIDVSDVSKELLRRQLLLSGSSWPDIHIVGALKP